MGLGQNDVVLALQLLFFWNSAYTKTTSFWIVLVQNDIVLQQLSHTQNDIVWVSNSCFKTTSFCYVFKKNKNETTSFYFLQRQNDVVSPAPNAQIQEPVPRSSLQRGEDMAAWPATARLDRRSHMMSELAAAADDWGFGPTSERWAGGRRRWFCEATLQPA